MNKNKKKFPQGSILTIVVISLIVGGLTGGVTGFLTASIFSGSLSDWLSNPLGIRQIVSPTESQVNQNINQPFPNGQLNVLEEESLTTKAVKKVTPAVVSIIVTKELQQYYNYTGPNFPFDDFFNFPFDNFFRFPQQIPGPTEEREIGVGTGFIISSDGLILTNKHVVSDTEANYSIVLNDGIQYEAEVVDRDLFNDIAFLKIEAENLPIAELGDSDKIEIGQTVITIGYALGEYSNSVTKGIVSGIGRDIVASSGGRSERLEGVIQTDAAINPGNSGGPLINLQGQVIGINTAVNLEGQLIGFAIPINSAKPLVASVKEHGRIIRPFLGVRYIMLNQQIAKENQIAVDYGALLVKGDEPTELAVVPGGPADKAGLEESDIILELNGVMLDNDNPLFKEIAKHQPGDIITLKVLHDGEEKMMTVELVEFEE